MKYLTGTRVKEISIKEMHHYVDMNQSASGIYFVRVLSSVRGKEVGDLLIKNADNTDCADARR